MATTTPSIFRDPASGSASFSASSTPSSLQPSTTQPYGTDEEFYARTDLVHFHVDINDLEGSGAIWSEKRVIFWIKTNLIILFEFYLKTALE